MQSLQLGSVGWGYTEPVVWSTLGTTCGRCQAGLEIPLDLPMWSLVGQQDWKKCSDDPAFFMNLTALRRANLTVAFNLDYFKKNPDVLTMRGNLTTCPSIFRPMRSLYVHANPIKCLIFAHISCQSSFRLPSFSTRPTHKIWNLRFSGKKAPRNFDRRKSYRFYFLIDFSRRIRSCDRSRPKSDLIRIIRNLYHLLFPPKESRTQRIFSPRNRPNLLWNLTAK